MTAGVPRRSALILSTTPPIPRDYGNRNRVFQTTAFFRRLQFSVSFLLYPFDNDWATALPDYYKELVESFDYFATIPNSRPLHQPARGYHHEIDEWWDDNIGQYLAWLFKRKRFDVFLVNYTFLSKAFEYAPRRTLKILDTHDLFTGRREEFEKHGVAAEFFYTNEQQERIGFDRSDLIIAIKDREKEIIQTMTSRQVECLPYWDDREAERCVLMAQPDAYDDERPLRLGFIGAYNSVNIVNMRRFLAAFTPYVRLYNLPVEIVIAGNVCGGLDDHPFLRKLGYVEDISDFYRSVDIIVAPLEFSTGIKIKVGEALARRVPVLATRNAFCGFRAYHSTQDLPDVAAVCEAIVCAAHGEPTLAELATAAQKAAITAARAQERAFAALQGRVTAACRRVLLVVDRPFWLRTTFFDELVAQAIELLSQMGRLIVCYIGEDILAAERVYAKVDYVHVRALDERLAATFEVVCTDYNVTGAVVTAATRQTEEIILAQLQPHPVATWVLSIAARGINTGVMFGEASRTEQMIEVAPLRYLPIQRQPPVCSHNCINLFVSTAADEWTQIAQGYVESIAGELGLPVRTISAPPHHEFDTQFFHAALALAAGKCILIASEEFYPAFLLQLLALSKGAGLVLHPHFICPEYIEANAMPSLEGSLRTFLRGELGARTQAGPDTGWLAMSDRLVEGISQNRPILP
jgi:hypothetical protein